MATTLKGKSSVTGTALSPRVNGHPHSASASTPRSPTSPAAHTSPLLLQGAGAASTSTSGYTRASSGSRSNGNGSINAPLSPMKATFPTLAGHHYQEQQHQHQHQQPPPRFRQQQHSNKNSNQTDNQYANYPRSPVPSTSSLAVPPSTSRGHYANNGSNTSPSNNGVLSSTNNPTIASMQSSSYHHHSNQPKQQQYISQPHQSAQTSSSASTSTSPHYNNAPSSASSSSHTHAAPPQHSHSHYNPSSSRLPRPSETFTRELSNVLQHTFIPSILPSAEEYKTKENARKYLEYLADRITPGAKLLPFGSQANGLALRNSDMDLCYISPPGKPRKPPSELVEQLGRMIEVEAPVFAVKMLSRARIPIIKLSPSPIYHLRKQEADLAAQQAQSSQSQSAEIETSMRKVSSASAPASSSTSRPSSSSKDGTSDQACQAPNSKNTTSPSTSAASPTASNSRLPPSIPPPMPEYGLSCDIGFENRLALENTRLLLTYAMADPRLRTIVLFLKVWTKRRKINNSYLGTLSSYGYVLLVIHFLINVRKPPVLPNLQRLRPHGVTPLNATEYEGRDIYFFDDLELLPRYWQSTNRDNVGELLIAFFHYYHKEFRYAFDVVSIRSEGGILNKVAKGWMNDQSLDSAIDTSGTDNATTTPGQNRNIPRDLNRLCIEDPFQTDYNVARTVTVDGLFTIRGEIARATGILRGTRSDVNAVIAELLEEREDYLVHAPPPNTNNRRRSAPSPRLQPSVLATHQDFRTWALANGVPHAQGGNMPMFPHQLHGAPSLIDEMNGTGQGTGLTAINAEALARYQQASQALSQANLQQQQAQQQQLLASLPALLAATSLRNPSRATSRRFHEHAYKQMRTQQGTIPHQQQNAFSQQQMLSPLQAQHAFQNNALLSASMGLLHPSTSPNQTFSRSTNDASMHLTRPPMLERRSSWDGSAASDETRQNFRGTVSVSEAGVRQAPPDVGTTTAPTSPAMHNGQLPAFASHAMYQAGPSSVASPTLSTVSIATAPAGSMNQYGVGQGLDRQAGVYANQWPLSSSSGYGRSPADATRTDQHYHKSPGQYTQNSMQPEVGASLPMQAYPTGLPKGKLPFAESAPIDYSARAMNLPVGSALSTTSTSASVSGSPSMNAEDGPLEERDVVVDDGTIPSPSSIRFGNFDAAFYSSEPTDMAGLGLFDASSSSDGSPQSFTGTPSFENSSIPEEVELPPPVRLPPQHLASFAASMRVAQRFRPQLADIPASPAAKNMPGPESSSRRPSLQSNRRRSAGDEVGLGLGDVTFFGKIPVSKNEDEREKAMAALLKESSKDFKPSSVASSSATSQIDSMHVEKDSTTESVTSSAPTNDSSVVSAPRRTPASSPRVPFSLTASPSGKTLTSTDTPSKSQATARSGPSYATLAASRPSLPRKTTGA